MKSKISLIFLFGLISWQFASAQFLGGAADGYDESEFENSINIFAGASEDGYDSAEFSNSINIYRGGAKDGHVTLAFDNSISIFRGGAKDGYASENKIVSFIWVGVVGTGWNVTGNWKEGVIPNINSTVIIPQSALNFPQINAGVMRIGLDPTSNGDYLCKNVSIQSGAEMTLRVNAFLENRGNINIRGNVYVLNSAINAVQNLNNGLIEVKNGGSLNFTPN